MTEFGRISKVCEGCDQPVNQCKCSKSRELPTAATVEKDMRKGGIRLDNIHYSAFEAGDELVRRQDVEQLFKPQQHARKLENLSRRLQAAATNPFDKEEVLTVAKELLDISNKRAELLEEVKTE